MSAAANPESVAPANRDTPRASASASVAHSAALPSAAAASSSQPLTRHSAFAAAASSATGIAAAAVAPLSAAHDATLPATSLAQELATVHLHIAHVEGEIAAVEAEIIEVKQARDACLAGSELRQEHTGELQRLGRKEDRLRDEKAQLRDELKRKELALEHIHAVSPGQSVSAPRLLFPPSVPLLILI